MKSYSVSFSPSQEKTEAEAAGCYCIYENKILILKRHPSKFEGNTWGVPGGKLEIQEEALDACQREVQEEVGLNLEKSLIKSLGTMYVKRDKTLFAFHLFSYLFNTFPTVHLELSEHTEYGWFTIDEAKKLPLISSGIEALEFFASKSLIF